MRGVVEFSFDAEPNKIVDGGKKRGESFTRTGRRGDQRVPLFLDFRPGLRLRLGRSGKGPGKPARYCWMKNFEIHRDGHYTWRARVCIAETQAQVWNEHSVHITTQS